MNEFKQFDQAFEDYNNYIESIKNTKFDPGEKERNENAFELALSHSLNRALEIIRTNFNNDFKLYEVGETLDSNFNKITTNVKRNYNVILKEINSYKKEENSNEINKAIDIIKLYCDRNGFKEVKEIKKEEAKIINNIKENVTRIVKPIEKKPLTLGNKIVIGLYLIIIIYLSSLVSMSIGYLNINTYLTILSGLLFQFVGLILIPKIYKNNNVTTKDMFIPLLFISLLQVNIVKILSPLLNVSGFYNSLFVMMLMGNLMNMIYLFPLVYFIYILFDFIKKSDNKIIDYITFIYIVYILFIRGIYYLINILGGDFGALKLIYSYNHFILINNIIIAVLLITNMILTIRKYNK